GSIAGLNNGFTKSGSGTLTLNTSNGFAGNLDVQAGALRIGKFNAIPSGFGRGGVTIFRTLGLNCNSNQIHCLAGAGTVDNLSGSLTYTLATGINDASGTFSGLIKNTSGTLGITKQGAGILQLSGNNSFSGSVAIGAGAIRISHANALGNTAGN